MVIEVYGKEGCAICDAAKEKLKILGLPFTVHDLAATIELHEGWRADGSTEVMAAYSNNNNHMPVLLIDGKGYSYSDAMGKLKKEEDDQAPS